MIKQCPHCKGQMFLDETDYGKEWKCLQCGRVLTIQASPSTATIERDQYSKDKGCKYAESCLNCPFQECIYSRSYKQIQRDKRNERIRKLYAQGKKCKDIAALVGVEVKTVYRHIKE